MKRMILPLLLLILGLGGGIGAGLYLTPAPAAEAAELAELGPCGVVEPDPHAADAHAEAEADTGDGHGGSAGGALGAGHEYVKLNNQFVIPVVQATEVAALVIMSISVEVPAGQQEDVLLVEPKLRDVFLQVLFDHANTGGFAGTFTSSDNMRSLRTALRVAAQDALGESISDVLIVDLVRQDV